MVRGRRMSRRMIAFHCYQCNTSVDKFVDSTTIKLRCNCDHTLHKIIAAANFSQRAGHVSVNTSGNKGFDAAGKKQPPVRSNPDEPDLEYEGA